MSAPVRSIPTQTPTAPTPLAVTQVPVSLLRTSLARLRSPAPCPRSADLAELPIRIVLQQDGLFEVVDGFKRLAHCRDGGQAMIPAVIECARSAPEIKRLLLRSNAPLRTVTPMDEARVIRSLNEDDHFSLTAVARLLGRRKSWGLPPLCACHPTLAGRAEWRGPWNGRSHPGLRPVCLEREASAGRPAIERHSLRSAEALVLVSV